MEAPITVQSQVSDQPHIAQPVYNVSDRLARIWLLKRMYSKLVMKSLLKVPVTDLIRMQFPFALADAKLPPNLAIELTNKCNLKCTYCSSTLARRPQGFMSRLVFERLTTEVRDVGIRRVSIVGNGEPTLHPQFDEFIRKAGRAARFVELTTNGTLLSEKNVTAILEAPVDVIHISVDSNTKTGYERSRVNGKFEYLLRNLERLMSAKVSSRSSILVSIRLMLRPSEMAARDELTSFWKPYGDVVSHHYVMNFMGLDADGFVPLKQQDVYPRCSLPFKILDVRWNGDVPLCHYGTLQTGHPDGLLLGNIAEASLVELWTSATMRGYRKAHRDRAQPGMPICRGCIGT